MGHLPFGPSPWVKGYCSSCSHFWNPAKRKLSNGLWWIVLPLSRPLCNMNLLPIRKWSLFLFIPLESRWSCDLLSSIECCWSEIFKSYFKKICSFHFQSWNPDWSHLERKTIVNEISYGERNHMEENQGVPVWQQQQSPWYRIKLLWSSSPSQTTSDRHHPEQR